MKLLLTSSGIKNASIHAALVDLLGKPIAECNALFIPTGIYPFRRGATWRRRARPSRRHVPKSPAASTHAWEEIVFATPHGNIR